MKFWCSLLLCLLPALSWAGALRCEIDTGGALPFAPFTRENPIAVDENTPDYTVVLALDYAQFLPNMRLSCTSDGQELEAPPNFDGTITLTLSTVNDKALDWTGEAQTTNNGIKMKMYIKAVALGEDTPPSSYPSAKMVAGKRLGVEYPIIDGSADAKLVQFGAQYNAGKTLYKFDNKYNFAIQSMRVELIKLGWIEYRSEAVIPPGAHLTFSVDGLGSTASVDVPLGSGVYMASPSCALDNKHQTVDLGSISKSSGGTFPKAGPMTRFGMDFTCSSYTNNVDFTFQEPYTIVPGRDHLTPESAQNGEKLTGLAVEIYNSEGKTVRMDAKQSVGIAQKGKNTANFQAAIVQTEPNIVDASGKDFTGSFTAKANVVISYY
ncbi:fimbrial protein [Dryocola sp. BD626]|uniref:fimbrial protein n=1 Tax=Dryocola sp. BD626 TaxID=3133273 RepID=UPI003F50A98A